MVHRLNKLVRGRAKAAGYHIAANVEETNKYIDDKVNAEVANRAVAIKATMDDRALDSGATSSLVSSNETAANVANKLTSNTSNNHDASLATLKIISDCLEKVEMGGGRRRGRGRGRGHGGADKDVNPQAAGGERKPCLNCGKRHKVPNKKCWVLDANKHDRLTNYVKPPPGFNKGN